MNQLIGTTLAGVIIGASILAGAAMLRQPSPQPVSVTIDNPTREERCGDELRSNNGKPDYLLSDECQRLIFGHKLTWPPR
jgi:hypothetical protein